MAGLAEATAIARDGDRRVVRLDPAWNIWGPVGGYLASIALRAAGECAAPGHRPVSLSGQFVGVAKPDVPRFDALASLDRLMAERGVEPIAFWRNLDARSPALRLPGDPPPSDPHQYRWVRFRDWAPVDDPFVEAMRHVLLIDIGIWPAHRHRQDEPASYTAPSLDVWVQFHGGPPAGEWLLSAADADVSGHGLIDGRVRIWDGTGRAVATGGGQCLVMAPRAPAV